MNNSCEVLTTILAIVVFIKRIIHVFIDQNTK